MTEPVIPPDEQVLRLHLESGRFRSGVARGWWRLVKLEWPEVVVGIVASDGDEYGFKFHCSDYPKTPVTARPWDLATDTPLPAGRWPGGGGRVALAFNPSWKNASCLYLPCDRQALEGHDKWRQEHPALLWEPEKGICKYLRIVRDLLHSKDYGGRRAA